MSKRRTEVLAPSPVFILTFHSGNPSKLGLETFLRCENGESGSLGWKMMMMLSFRNRNNPHDTYQHSSYHRCSVTVAVVHAVVLDSLQRGTGNSARLAPLCTWSFHFQSRVGVGIKLGVLELEAPESFRQQPASFSSRGA